MCIFDLQGSSCLVKAHRSTHNTPHDTWTTPAVLQHHVKFPRLKEAACLAGAEEWLPWLISTGALDCKTALGLKTKALASGMPSDLWNALEIPLKGYAPRAALIQPSTRRDHPVAQPSQGGNLGFALQAAGPTQRARAMAHLQRDLYSQSNSGPLASRFRTWKQLTAAWGLAALQLTVDTVLAVAASLKAGGYRSARLYFSAAKKAHILEHGPCPAEVEVTIQDCISADKGQRA